MIPVLPTSLEIAPDLSASELLAFLRSVLVEQNQNWKVSVFRGTDDRGAGSILSIQIDPQPVHVVPEEGIKQLVNSGKAPVEDRVRMLKAMKPLIEEQYKKARKKYGVPVPVDLEQAYKIVSRA